MSRGMLAFFFLLSSAMYTPRVTAMLKWAPVSFPESTAPVSTPFTITAALPALKLMAPTRMAVPMASRSPMVAS